jgi:hypothetical protein
MPLDLPGNTRLRVTGFDKGFDHIELMGVLNLTSWPPLSVALRDFFAAGRSIELDLTRVDSYDPSITFELFALRCIAKQHGTQLRFTAPNSASRDQLPPHTLGSTLEALEV